MAWERCRYRGNKVWILVDEAGQATLDDRGHAQLRYKPDDDRTYTVRPAEIRPLEASPGEVSPDEVSPDDAPPPRKRPPIEAWIHAGEPTPDGWVGIGILLAWRDRRRELSQRLPAASDDEIAVGAVLHAIRAIRKPTWPVRIRIAAAERLEAIRSGAGTVPPECGEALRLAAGSFTDLELLQLPTPAPPDAVHAERLAHGAHTR